MTARPNRRHTNDPGIVPVLFPLLRPYRWTVLAVVLLGATASVSEGAGIGLFAAAFDALKESRPELNPVVLAGWIFGLILLKNTLLLVARALAARIAGDCGHQMRCSIFDQLMTVHYSYWKEHDSGRLLDVLSTETWRAAEAVNISLDLMVRACTVLVFSTMLFFISWRWTLAVTAGVLVVSKIVTLAAARLKDLGNRNAHENGLIAQSMLDAVMGLKEIHYYGLEGERFRRFQQMSDRVRSIVSHIETYAYFPYAVSEVLYVALLLSLFLIASASGAPLPELIVFLLVLYRLQPQIAAFDGSRARIAGLLGAIQAVDDVTGREDKSYLKDGSTRIFTLSQGIAIDSVTFRYAQNDEPALRNVSFSIPAGSVTALVGPSGSGKSTLVNLITRLYEVETGRITVDSVPLKDLRLAEWRSRIAVVTQDCYLFSGTIAENISVGRVGASRAEIIEAARKSHAHEFISELPEGYDTQIGSQGLRLSNGQRQRVALARAFLRNPEILILDEATNALDSISENFIQGSISELQRGRTSLVIAHRLSTVRQADHVVVLRKGEVFEQGSPRELLGAPGLFAELYNLQRLPE